MKIIESAKYKSLKIKSINRLKSKDKKIREKIFLNIIVLPPNEIIFCLILHLVYYIEKQIQINYIKKKKLLIHE